MPQSVITRKWQTTIPKEIRKLLKIKPNDRLLYLVEDGRVVLKAIHGDILDLRGSVPARERPEDFGKIREETKKMISKRLAEAH
ncbi:MAG: type II toxin-antitoxin system PrlF family antitoxin [Desulfoferrobacter sp.]